jgi:uncharacterized membrane protein YdjX (TVP38/TMEM64 family)
MVDRTDRAASSPLRGGRLALKFDDPGAFLPRLPAWARLPGGLAGGERPTLRAAGRYAALVAAAAGLLAAAHWLASSGVLADVAAAAGSAAVAQWRAAHPLAAAAAFASIEAVAVVLLVPASVFCLLAGALFGSVGGAVTGWAGLVVGQTAAFLLGRTLLRARVAAWLAAAPPRWATLDAALARGGWRLVALLRLSPALPWNALNIALAATSVRFTPYALASAVAVAPWAALFAYAGSLAASLADVVEGRAGPTGPAAVAAAAAGAVATAAAASYAVLLARRAMSDALKGEGGAAERVVVESLANDAETRESEGGVEGGGGGGDLELGAVGGRP